MTVHTPGWVEVMVQGTRCCKGSVRWQESSSMSKGNDAVWEVLISLIVVSRPTVAISDSSPVSSTKDEGT